jgi:hypothetical protein
MQGLPWREVMVKTEKAVKKLSHLKSQAGYILLSLMTLTALIPGLVLIGLNYTDIIEQGSRISKTTITKTQMHTIRNIVANDARDVDADGAFDVWREGAGNAVPAAVTVNSRDQWGTDFRYCAYDLLACNQVDAAFSQNSPNAPCVGFSPPTTNLVLRIISAGRDRAFQTDCRSANAVGDDIVMNETEAGIRAGGTGGWIDDGSVVRLTDPNDRVGIGTPTPLGSLDVLGRTFLTLENTANNWVYLRGNVHGTLPSASALQGLIYGWNSSGGLGESQILYSTALGAAPRLDFGRWSGTVRTIDMTLRDGNVGIGAMTPASRLHVVGGSQTSAIIATGNNSYHSDWPGGWGGGLATWDVVGASALFSGYLTRSDINRKTDIEEIKYGLPAVMNLRPVMFRWKNDKLNRPLKDIGFISQEVEKIIPELVIGEDGNKGLSYDRITAVLVKAIQEQQKEIEKLESNIKQLESNNASTASQNLDVTDIAFKSIVMILFIVLFIKINKTKRGIKHG